MRRHFLAAIIAIAVLLGSCSSSDDKADGLQVVATTSIIADVVANVGVEFVEVRTLLLPGSDPHSFELRPQDIVLLSEADVVFANGLGLEDFLASALDAAGEDIRLVEISQQIIAHDFENHQNAEDNDGEHGVDPHVWMNPHNVIFWVDVIAENLAELDPERAAEFTAQAQVYIADLNALDTWIQEQVATIPAPQRRLVTDHDSFGYFAEHYGFEVVGLVLPGYSSLGEPSANELAELSELVSDLGVPSIFVGRTVNPVLAEQVAADTGVELVPVYTGSLSQADGPAATYLQMMRYNTEAIVAALR